MLAMKINSPRFGYFICNSDEGDVGSHTFWRRELLEFNDHYQHRLVLKTRWCDDSHGLCSDSCVIIIREWNPLRS